MKSSVIVCVLTGVLYGQGVPDSSPDAVFHATTKLVQLSVIAQDKNGAPVSDLRREDFTLLDNGSPQEIRVFLTEASKPLSTPRCLRTRSRIAPLLSTRFFISPKADLKFARANVAIYPVDLNGVKAGSRGDPEMLAAMTGGIVYNKRNDLDVAMREAIDDGRVSYTLGYYQPGKGDDPMPHRIAIRVSRPGLTLRYRPSYDPDPPKPKSASPWQRSSKR